MLGFVLHFVMVGIKQLGVAPFVVHAGVDEILVARAEFAGNQFVQISDNFWISLHGISPVNDLKG